MTIGQVIIPEHYNRGTKKVCVQDGDEEGKSVWFERRQTGKNMQEYR